MTKWDLVEDLCWRGIISAEVSRGFLTTDDGEPTSLYRHIQACEECAERREAKARRQGQKV